MPGMTTEQIADRLCTLCREGNFSGAVDELYADDIVSVEPVGGPDHPAEQRGIAAIRGKGEWWEANHDVHACDVGGPYPHGDRFAVTFALDITPKVGPAAGQRIQMSEVALYTVRDGKIAREEFFYRAGP